MILPVVAYGDPVLRKRADDISEDYPGLPKLIDDMFETMYHASGVGLAAPQIGLPIRLFVIDGSPFEDEDEEAAGLKGAFINAVIRNEEGELWKFNEGCLSIPRVREDVARKEVIHIEYYDRDWNLKKETYSGVAARIIQHEYDHIQGVLFIDHISPLRRRLLQKRLDEISKGKVSVEYKMKFPIKK
ncbi:MAG: peptide deformylase [Bacteroidota bacterium]